MSFANPRSILEQFSISDGMEVADFGAGAGHYSIALSDMVGTEGRVYVIDVQEGLLTKARTLDHKKRDNLRFIRGDLEEEHGSHLKDDMLDAVVLSNVLFQIEKKELPLQEAFRVLRNGGRLLVIDWTDSFGGLGPQPEYVVSKQEAQNLAQRVGFTVLKEIDAGDHHYGLIFRKP